MTQAAWASAYCRDYSGRQQNGDLRRTATRNLRPARIAEGVIMKIGGWRTRSVFERYAIVDQSDIAAAVKRLEASEQKAGNGYSSATVEEESTVVATMQTVN